MGGERAGEAHGLAVGDKLCDTEWKGRTRTGGVVDAGPPSPIITMPGMGGSPRAGRREHALGGTGGAAAGAKGEERASFTLAMAAGEGCCWEVAGWRELLGGVGDVIVPAHALVKQLAVEEGSFGLGDAAFSGNSADTSTRVPESGRTSLTEGTAIGDGGSIDFGETDGREGVGSVGIGIGVGMPGPGWSYGFGFSPMIR